MISTGKQQDSRQTDLQEQLRKELAEQVMIWCVNTTSKDDASGWWWLPVRRRNVAVLLWLLYEIEEEAETRGECMLYYGSARDNRSRRDGNTVVCFTQRHSTRCMRTRGKTKIFYCWRIRDDWCNVVTPRVCEGWADHRTRALLIKCLSGRWWEWEKGKWCFGGSAVKITMTLELQFLRMLIHDSSWHSVYYTTAPPKVEITPLGLIRCIPFSLIVVNYCVK